MPLGVTNLIALGNPPSCNLTLGEADDGAGEQPGQVRQNPMPSLNWIDAIFGTTVETKFTAVTGTAFGTAQPIEAAPKH